MFNSIYKISTQRFFAIFLLNCLLFTLIPFVLKFQDYSRRVCDKLKQIIIMIQCLSLTLHGEAALCPVLSEPVRCPAAVHPGVLGENLLDHQRAESPVTKEMEILRLRNLLFIVEPDHLRGGETWERSSYFLQHGHEEEHNNQRGNKYTHPVLKQKYRYSCLKILW